MRRPRQVPVKGRIISAVSVLVCSMAVLSGCAASSPATGSTPAARRPVAAMPVFTVTGGYPVRPGGSQDTYAQAPGAGCDSATLSDDEALGRRVAAGFALAGFAASASLLEHFLAGTGTAVSYPAGSPVSREALASSPFRAVNSEVQEAILSQLKAGRASVQLSAAQLPPVAFESTSADLYWGFRGTQGLAVTGRGSRENGRFTGTLTYIIRDSYGFPASDTLDGFGPPMRYLQTACGAPLHPGGARWFPDTITVTVAFSQPA